MAAYKITKTGEGIIPEGETIIKKDAFKMCKKLTSIVIPEGVTTIENGAFKDCINLTSVTFPNSLEDIYWEAFSGCTGLTTISIPENVCYIEPWAFHCCENLSSIVVAEGNKQYDSRNNCNAIIKTDSNKLLFGCANTIIPDTVAEIEAFAFIRCRNLTSISIPDSVTTIGHSAFALCTNLISVRIPEGVEIGKEAFLGCPCMENKHEESTASVQEEKVPVTFTYEGELAFSVEGECTVQMTAKELSLFRQLIQQSEDEDVEDVLEFFKENMPESLYDDIYYEIRYQIRYNDAKDAIECEGRLYFNDMDDVLYDSMTTDELINRFLDDNAEGIFDFSIRSIELKNYAMKNLKRK